MKQIRIQIGVSYEIGKALSIASDPGDPISLEEWLENLLPPEDIEAALDLFYDQFDLNPEIVEIAIDGALIFVDDLDPSERFGSNVVVDNGDGGILLTAAVSEEEAYNRVFANYVGLTPENVPLGNHGPGVKIADSSILRVGSEQAFDRNVISANEGDGVLITGDQTDGISVTGSFIGIGVDGTGDFGNTGAGVRINNDAANVFVGIWGESEDAYLENIISANGNAGIVVTDNDIESVGFVGIAGNIIGLDAEGDPLPNYEGIAVVDSSSVIIGGTLVGNVVAGNTHDGVRVSGSETLEVYLFNNYIGTDSGLTAEIGNGSDGVRVENSALGVVIGAPSILPWGEAEDFGNVIGGNAGNGIHMFGAAVSDNRVAYNWIGTNRSGEVARLNGEDGIRIEASCMTTAGDENALLNNLISVAATKARIALLQDANASIGTPPLTNVDLIDGDSDTQDDDLE